MKVHDSTRVLLLVILCTEDYDMNTWEKRTFVVGPGLRGGEEEASVRRGVGGNDMKEVSACVRASYCVCAAR